MQIDGCCPCFQEIVSWVVETSSSLLETVRDVGSWFFEQGRNLARYFYLREPSAQDDKVQDIRERIIPSPGASEEDEFDPQLEAVKQATAELHHLEEAAQELSDVRISRDIQSLKAAMCAAVKSLETQGPWEIPLCRYSYCSNQPKLHIYCPQAVSRVLSEVSSHFDVTAGQIELSYEAGSDRVVWKRSLQFQCKENPDPFVYGFGRDLHSQIPKTAS